MKIPGPFAIELQGIRKQFAKESCPLFDDFSLAIPAGQAVAIVGHSGSGKTTLLNIMALLTDTQGGSLRIRGVPKSPLEVGSIPLAYIFQRDALLPWSTVLDNVLLGKACRKNIGPADRAAAAEFLGKFGLDGYKGAYPSELSAGQRQLVAIAQNLLTDPEILLLDEPFANLDFHTKLLMEEELLRLLDGQLGGTGRTVVLVTHDIEEALVIADRVVVVGRPPGHAARIAMDAPVPLDRAGRHPVNSRDAAPIRALFDEVWSTIRPFVVQRSIVAV